MTSLLRKINRVHLSIIAALGIAGVIEVVYFALFPMLALSIWTIIVVFGGILVLFYTITLFVVARFVRILFFPAACCIALMLGVVGMQARNPGLLIAYSRIIILFGKSCEVYENRDGCEMERDVRSVLFDGTGDIVTLWKVGDADDPKATDRFCRFIRANFSEVMNVQRVDSTHLTVIFR